ncbi:hypothetical protein DV707_17350 (plasmid) [Halobellus limi]|uniref:ATP-binding cassette domain-containing protein n=1 Tax=Halobellus limi TaxID=699433 RepID=A0A4D6H6T6_9EURY|nr:hypothetical protein DV707_17350 [Halobellus limi]
MNIGEGEFIGFLGPNRAGKTTTIRFSSRVTIPLQPLFKRPDD